jgi:hypothetical protein
VAVAVAIATTATTAGCAQIFGFDETSPYADDGVRLSYQRKRAGATIVDEAMDLTAGSATVLVADAAEPTGLRRIPAVLEDADTWFVDLPPATPAEILFDLPDDELIRIYAFPHRTISALYGVLGDPAPEVAPPNAQLDLNVTLDVAYTAEELMVYVVGAWARRNFAELPAAGAAVWDPPAVAYAAFASLAGTLDRIRSADAVMALRYAGNTLAGYAALPPFDQQDGVDAVTGTMTTVAADRTLDAVFVPTVAGPRFAATTPAMANLTMSWSVVAAPATAITSNTGPSLTSGSVLETDTGVVQVAFGNPTPWDPAVTFNTSATRDYTPPGAIAAVTLRAGLYTVDVPGGAGQTFDLPAGLPLLVTLGGRALTTDGAVVTLDRTRAIELSYVLDRDACDLYSATIYELVDDGAGTFSLVSRVGIDGAAPSFLVPPELIEAGKRYMIRAQCRLGGMPGLATGDLVTRAWPTSVGYFDSAVFEVAP